MMNIQFDRSGTLPGLRNAISSALRDGIGGIAILIAQDNGFTPSMLEPLLRSVKAPVAGGIFPTVIYGGKAYRRGSVVLAFRGKVRVRTIRGLGSGVPDLDGPLGELEEDSSWARTMLVFVDGFLPRVTPFMHCLFDVFGLEINYIGGGAGVLEAAAQPCLLSSEGVTSGGAVLAMVETPSGVGVAHGWKPMSQPLQATRVDGNILKEIDFQPAFEVYAAEISRNAGMSPRREAFPDWSRRYPFGIARMNREMIVRDPLRVTPDGALVCAGEIPHDCYLSIMTGDEASLEAAAERAATIAVEALPVGKPASFLQMDCISRRLFLGDRFDGELVKMAPGGLPSAGACTIGEIANSGAEFLEFYNKTAVVAAMGGA